MCICNLFLPMIRTGTSGWLSKALATLDRTKYAPASRVSRGTVLGIHTFGPSAPMKVVAQHFGFEPEHVVAAAKEQIARHAQSSEPGGTGSISGGAE
jgi:pyruvate dehydrogenase complex dehydrogenase (E1) component